MSIIGSQLADLSISTAKIADGTIDHLTTFLNATSLTQGMPFVSIHTIASGGPPDNICLFNANFPRKSCVACFLLNMTAPNNTVLFLKNSPEALPPLGTAIPITEQVSVNGVTGLTIIGRGTSDCIDTNGSVYLETNNDVVSGYLLIFWLFQP